MQACASQLLFRWRSYIQLESPGFPTLPSPVMRSSDSATLPWCRRVAGYTCPVSVQGAAHWLADWGSDSIGFLDEPPVIKCGEAENSKQKDKTCPNLSHPVGSGIWGRPTNQEKLVSLELYRTFVCGNLCCSMLFIALRALGCSKMRLCGLCMLVLSRCLTSAATGRFKMFDLVFVHKPGGPRGELPRAQLQSGSKR